MSPSASLTADQLRDAVRDLVGIFRAMYVATKERYKRVAYAEAGQKLLALHFALDAYAFESAEVKAAMLEADLAVNAACNVLHWSSESLHPVIGAAITRVRRR